VREEKRKHYPMLGNARYLTRFYIRETNIKRLARIARIALAASSFARVREILTGGVYTLINVKRSADSDDALDDLCQRQRVKSSESRRNKTIRIKFVIRKFPVYVGSELNLSSMIPRSVPFLEEAQANGRKRSKFGKSSPCYLLSNM